MMAEIIEHPGACPERRPLFAKAYPAPWRIEGDLVLDRDGSHITAFEAGDWDEGFFWSGIVHCVDLVGNVFEGLIDESGNLIEDRPVGELLRRMATTLPDLEDAGDVFNPHGSGPVPIEEREGR